MPSFDLTKHERAVLAKMVEGLNNTQIDARLLPAHPTVKSHVSNIQSKLGVASCMEAVTIVMRNRIIL
jgi:DNA-binding NarL/FixJ family response regulator